MDKNKISIEKIKSDKKKIWKFLFVFLSLDLYIVSAIICVALLEWKVVQPICWIMIAVIILKPFLAFALKVHMTTKWYSSAAQSTLSRIPGRKGQGVGDLYFSVFFIPLIDILFFFECLRNIRRYIKKGKDLPSRVWTEQGGKKDWRDE